MIKKLSIILGFIIGACPILAEQAHPASQAPINKIAKTVAQKRSSKRYKLQCALKAYLQMDTSTCHLQDIEDGKK